MGFPLRCRTVDVLLTVVMARYPSLLDVHVLLDNREQVEDVLTDWDCSGNGEASARGGEPLRTSGDEAEGDTLSELANYMRDEFHRLQDEPPFTVGTTAWQGKAERELTPLYEARVIYDPAARRAVIYLPEGRGCMVGLAAWITGRVRAERAKAAEETMQRFPTAMVPAIDTVLRKEGRKGRHLVLSRWAKMFTLFGEGSVGLWTQFHCGDCGFVRRTPVWAAEAVAQAERDGTARCSAVGVACHMKESDEQHGWLGVQVVLPQPTDRAEEAVSKGFQSPSSQIEIGRNAPSESDIGMS